MIPIPERGIYLASRSPRRRELLSQIGVRYHLLLFRERVGENPDVDESVLAGEAPAAYVERMAKAKAEAGWRRMLQRNLPPAPVLAADTTVALDGPHLRQARQPRAKRRRSSPRSPASATRCSPRWRSRTTSCSKSRFRFPRCSSRRSPRTRSRQYVATGEADDKAGAYGIQGRAARFVVELRGSYSGVMGLPLYETSQLLDKLRERRNPY